MTKLGQLLAQRVMRGGFACRSTVTAGTQQGDMEEFRLSQQIPLARLREADSGSLDLGLRLKAKRELAESAHWLL